MPSCATANAPLACVAWANMHGSVAFVLLSELMNWERVIAERDIVDETGFYIASISDPLLCFLA